MMEDGQHRLTQKIFFRSGFELLKSLLHSEFFRIQGETSTFPSPLFGYTLTHNSIPDFPLKNMILVDSAYSQPGLQPSLVYNKPIPRSRQSLFENNHLCGVGYNEL